MSYAQGKAAEAQELYKQLQKQRQLDLEQQPEEGACFWTYRQACTLITPQYVHDGCSATRCMIYSLLVGYPQWTYLNAAWLD